MVTNSTVMQKALHKLFIMLTAILVLSGTAMAQVEVSATADRTTVALGEQIVVTVRLVSSKRITMSGAPTLPANPNFDVLGTNQNQSTSSSVQFINGQMAQQTEITYLFYYTLAPKKTGTFEFPALSISVGGQNYSTAPITIGVGVAPPGAAADMRVSFELSKRSLHVGEQGLVTIVIAKKASAPSQLAQEGLDEFRMNFEKGVATNLSVVRLFNQYPPGKQERIGNEMYHVFRLPYAVFSLSSGTISIPSQRLQYIEVQRVAGRRGDPFGDDFFGGGFFGPQVQQTVKSIMSGSASMAVSALPQPTPTGFSGAVGQYSISASVSPLEVAAGDAVTLKVMLRGTTRPGSIGDIELPPMPGIEAFTPEKNVSSDTSAAGLAAVKTFKFLLIPREEGTATIPAIAFPYFDPGSASYKTIQTQLFLIKVLKGKEGANNQQTRHLTQQDVRVFGQDINYIKTRSTLKAQSEKPYSSSMLFLFIIPFLGTAITGILRVRQTYVSKNEFRMIRNKALARAVRSLAELDKKGGSVTGVDYLSAIALILEKCISDKFGFSAIGVTHDELRERLVGRGVTQQTADLARSLLEQLDTARFGGQQINEAFKTSVGRQTRVICEGLVKEAKRDTPV